MSAVEDAAVACMEEECSVDTVNDLLMELKAEAASMKSSHQQALVATIVALEALNKQPEANKSEIEKLVLGASRSFSTIERFGFPGPAIGYSMKPGSTTTAGKSLE